MLRKQLSKLKYIFNKFFKWYISVKDYESHVYGMVNYVDIYILKTRQYPVTISGGGAEESIPRQTGKKSRVPEEQKGVWGCQEGEKDKHFFLDCFVLV